MKASATLRAARLLITEPRHWCTSGGQHRNGCFTALTAIMSASGDGTYRAASFLRRVTGEDLITIWNDAPGRTHAEVLRAFDGAIALAEKEGQ